MVSVPISPRKFQRRVNPTPRARKVTVAFIENCRNVFVMIAIESAFGADTQNPCESPRANGLDARLIVPTFAEFFAGYLHMHAYVHTHIISPSISPSLTLPHSHIRLFSFLDGVFLDVKPNPT
eukprot:m.95658 g.95658  ORF g.95658 m.95658 type:complete len:123 (+) comp26839_c0_seq3:1317-1685(+)